LLSTGDGELDTRRVTGAAFSELELCHSIGDVLSDSDARSVLILLPNDPLRE
jgi:hypothetical protein